jgi:hypothetical protein
MRMMNKVLPTLSLMMLVSAVGSTRVQAQAFEGTLTFLAHGKDGDKIITEWVKGTNTRYDFSGAASGGAPSSCRRGRCT